jgi:hypothetical protein
MAYAFLSGPPGPATTPPDPSTTPTTTSTMSGWEVGLIVAAACGTLIVLAVLGTAQEAAKDVAEVTSVGILGDTAVKIFKSNRGRKRSRRRSRR